jgi:hypothetical protein
MPHVGFEPIIPVFERAKSFRDIDHTANVIGIHEKWTALLDCP